MFIRKAKYDLLIKEKETLEDAILRLRDMIKTHLSTINRLKRENSEVYSKNIDLLQDIKNLKTTLRKLNKEKRKDEKKENVESTEKTEKTKTSRRRRRKRKRNSQRNEENS